MPNYASQIRLTKAVRPWNGVPTRRFPIPPAAVPVASFIATPDSGQFPLAVTFQEASWNKPSSFLWNFGDGTTSTERNPTHVYMSLGPFSPSLTVTNSAGSDTFVLTDGILTSAPPSLNAEFSADTTLGAIPLNVTFTQLSSNGETDWLWNFGDGSPPLLVHTSAPVNHTYTLPGNYTVTLTVSDGGVRAPNTVVKTAFIHAVNVTATPNFTWIPSNGVAPLTVNFTDTSTDPTIGGSASRAWDFTNDGTTDSSVLNPSHVYSIPGTYSVTLKTTNDGGTTQVTKSNIIVVAPSPAAVSFAASPTSGALPLTVTFTDTSIGTVTSRLWDFGDGTTSTAQNPSHTYSTAGLYTVSLTDTNAGGSNTATVSNMISVTNSPPLADFTASPLTGAIPLSVNFTNSSAGMNVTYQWDFNNDGTTDSTVPSPTAVFNVPGTYTVKLTAINDGGASVKTRTGYITVTNVAPATDFAASPTTGSIPLLVNFTDTTTGVIASRLWNFGDGNTSTAQNPSHSYSAVGTYTVTLTDTNDGGSITKTKTALVTAVNQPPVANFTYTPSTGQIPFTVNFTNTSTGVNQTAWSWNFGDGNTSTAQNPSHTYSTVGTYTVSLTVTNDGGNNTKTVNNAVVASLTPPVANFTVSPTTGTVPQTPTITNTTTGTVTSWLWDFGDGTTSTAQNPSKTYSVAGTYTITLTATNAGGSNTKTATNIVTYTSLAYNYMDSAKKSSGLTVDAPGLVLSAASDGIIMGHFGFNVNNSADGAQAYWEMIINNRGSGIWFGLAQADQPLTTGSYPGQNANGYSFASNGNAYNNGVGTPATFFTPNWLAADVTGIGIRISRNGGYSASQLHSDGSTSGIGAAWFGGGNIPAGVYYPVIRLMGGAQVTIKFGPTMAIRNYGVWTSGLE